MTAEIAHIRPEPVIGDTTWKLKDFLNQTIEEPQRLLAPWLCKGDLWMVFSGPGIGKTFFALNVAFAVASGSKFLNWEATDPAKVLYVDGEMSQWDMQQRLKDIVSRARHRSSGDVDAGLENFTGYAATSQSLGKLFPDLSDSEGRESLIKKAEGMDLVVIDNLTTTMRSGDPDKAMDWTPMQDALVELRKQNTAVLLVHHTNKSGDQTGTKAKEAILNGMIRLERPSDYAPAEGARFYIQWGKTRGLSGLDTVPILAHLVQEEDQPSKWTHEVLDNLKVHELVRLARTGSYSTQRALAEKMEVTPGRITQLRDQAINVYELCTLRQWKGWLQTARELETFEMEPDF